MQNAQLDDLHPCMSTFNTMIENIRSTSILDDKFKGSTSSAQTGYCAEMWKAQCQCLGWVTNVASLCQLKLKKSTPVSLALDASVGKRQSHLNVENWSESTFFSAVDKGEIRTKFQFT